MKEKTMTQCFVALLMPMIWTVFTCLPVVAEDDGEQGIKEAPCVSATAIVESCEIEGKITQVEFDPARGRWAPLHAVIKIRNTSDDGQKLTFFCQIISQDSKNHSDAFVFSEGTYQMAIAPRETIVREFPFVDLMASMPSGYMKDTVAIRIGRTPFKRYSDHIAIKPGKKLEVGDAPVTIAVITEQRDQAKPVVRAAGRKDLDVASKEIMEFYAAQPDNGHRKDAKLSVSEYRIEGLWEEMKMQLFRLDRGGLFSWNFLYADGQLTRLEIPTVGGAGLLEGAVHEKTLYLTSDWGSGILRTALYRTRRDKGGKIQTVELGVISSVGRRFDKKFLEDLTVKKVMTLLRPLKRGKAVRLTP
jgi:hypothetical protein